MVDVSLVSEAAWCEARRRAEVDPAARGEHSPALERIVRELYLTPRKPTAADH